MVHGLIGTSFHSALCAVRASIAITETAPVGLVAVENIRHGANGHQWSSPITDPSMKSALVTTNTTARQPRPAFPSLMVPASATSGSDRVELTRAMVSTGSVTRSE